MHLGAFVTTSSGDEGGIACLTSGGPLLLPRSPWVGWIVQPCTRAPVMANYFGQVGEFDPAKEDWTHYAERVEHFFTANAITNDEEKTALLLTTIGPTALKQNLLKRILWKYLSRIN